MLHEWMRFVSFEGSACLLCPPYLTESKLSKLDDSRFRAPNYVSRIEFLIPNLEFLIPYLCFVYRIPHSVSRGQSSCRTPEVCSADRAQRS